MDRLVELIEKGKETLKNKGIEERENWSIENGHIINWDLDIREGISLEITAL